MRILSRYFLASFLNLFAVILASSIAVIAVVEMLLHFEEMMSQERGLRGALSYLVLRVPSYYLPILIPVASFAATFLCLGLPARWSEITAIRAGGIPPQRIALPLLAAAALLSGAAFLVNETVVLNASREWHRMRSPGREITFRRGSFWYHRDDVIYNVEEADRDTRTLHGVRVFELTPEGRLRRSIHAERVEIDGEDWRFVDATFRTFDPLDPTAPPAIERAPEIVIPVARERELALLDASAETLSLSDLREYIADREREGRNSERYRALLSERLSDPLTVLLFALLAVPVGLGVDRNHNIAVAALQGIALLIVFYTVKTVASILAASGVAPAAASAWGVLALFAGFGGWLWARGPR